MAETTPTMLADRALIRLSGEDVRGFLQGLVTNDTAALDAGPLWTALLTPQGKTLFDFILWADGDAVLIDIRDSAELAQTGKAEGAVHIPRGSLEFKADLSAPTADKSLAYDKPVILHCAGGGRAALAGKLLKDMGYEQVHNLGGFKDWVEAGGKVEK